VTVTRWDARARRTGRQDVGHARADFQPRARGL